MDSLTTLSRRRDCITNSNGEGPDHGEVCDVRSFGLLKSKGSLVSIVRPTKSRSGVFQRLDFRGAGRKY